MTISEALGGKPVLLGNKSLLRDVSGIHRPEAISQCLHFMKTFCLCSLQGNGIDTP